MPREAETEMGKNAAKGVTGEEIWLDGKFVKWPDANVHVVSNLEDVAAVATDPSIQ